MSIKAATHSSKFGLLSNVKFDLFLFNSDAQGQSDYECYVEAVTIFDEFGQTKECEFVNSQAESAGKIKQQISEWSSADEEFLTKENTHSDVFAVIDNSGWLQAISNSQPKESYAQTYFDVEVTNKFSANDFYDKVFMFFMVALGILCAIIVLMVFLRCSARKQYDEVMEAKREWKRAQLQKE